MTTVACDGRSVSGDGMLTDDNIVCAMDAQKVVRLSDGRIAGFCGNAFNYAPFINWLETGDGDVPKIVDGLGCIVLNADGSITSYDEHGRTYEERGKWAIGSGSRFAISAMDLGLSAEEAVTYATTRDVFSGGVITTLFIETKLKAAA